MIPPFNDSGFLPPYTGENSTIDTLVSPYRTTMLNFATRFATSPERRAILRGLLAYRAALGAVGIADGYQWLNGSFCSDIERLETRPPGDIDVVTYACRPAHAKGSDEFKRFVAANLDVFHPIRTKDLFKVDAYFTDLDIRPHRLVDRASYWHGVFGHQRVTSLWKGMVRVDLQCDDAAALQHLDGLDAEHVVNQVRDADQATALTEGQNTERATDA